MILHLDTVTAAPQPVIPGTGPIRLAAMAKPPGWVRDLTHGRPDHGFAVGDEVALMEAALAERANPLLTQGGRAYDRYRETLSSRFAALASEQQLAPGVLAWHTHDAGLRFGRDGLPRGRLPGSRERGPIPSGAWLLCTCKPGTGCHLTILAPHLRAAGWDVRLYGVR